jgi:hypothetical protein
MVFVPNKQGVAYGFGRGDAPEEEGPGVLATLGAAAGVNPVVSSLRYLQRPTFPEQPGYDPVEDGRQSDLWLDHSDKLAVAKSPNEFKAIEDRIRKETADRQILQAAGGGGLVAEIVSGSISPTLAIPLIGQARGLKGVAQTLAYAGAAASADELALLATRETYTGRDALLGIAAGTVLGGLLGSAAKYMTPAEKKLFEGDMGGGQGPGAIQYTDPLGSNPEPRVDILPKPSKMPKAEKKALDADELEFLEIAEKEGLEAARTKYSGARTDDQSLSAGGRGPAQSIDSPNFVSRILNKYLSKLNPVTRVGMQTESPAARRFMLQASDAGLRGDDNVNFRPHASEGTIEARVREYDALEGQFLQELDDSFSRYITGNRRPDDELQGAMSARVKAALSNPESKMSNEEFNNEVFRVAQTGETSEIPEINKAAKAWENLSARIVEYAEEAHQFRKIGGDQVGKLFDPEGNLGPDAHKYVNHVFSETKIAEDPAGFVKMLSDNAELQSQNAFAKDYERFSKKRAKYERRLHNMSFTASEARAEYANIQSEIDELVNDPEYDAMHQEELRLGREIREAKKLTVEDEPNLLEQELKEELSDLRNDNPTFKQQRKRLTNLKAEQRELNLAAGRSEDVQQELLDRIEKLEVQDLNALERVLNAGMRLRKELDKVGEPAQGAKLKKLFKQLGNAMKKVETQDRQIARLYKKPLTEAQKFAAYNKAMIFGERRAKADAKAEQLIGEIDNVESFDVEGMQNMLRSVQDLNNVRVRDLNARRALRAEKLEQRVEELSPENLEELKRQIEGDLIDLEDAFDTKWRARGAEDLNIDRGEASFRTHAEEMGEELSQQIQGLRNPVAGLEILNGKRGPEKARVLNIPLEIKSKFLETDMERLSRIYTRQISADIELYRATGSVNAAPVFREMREDFSRLRARLSESDVRPKQRALYKQWAEGGPVDLNEVETVPITKDERADIIIALNRKQKSVEEDMRVVVSRLRHQRGVPKNPDGIMYRMGRVAKDMNVARYMGSVALSSVPDVGRPVMRFGFAKTLSNGWGMYAKGMERIKLTRAEARRIGVAWDPVMHNRVQHMMDVMDDYASRKTVGERAIGFAANKTGFVAGFDRWTAEMKQIAASVTIGELTNSMAVVLGKQKSSAKQMKTAKTMLAQSGIDEQMANRMWNEMQREGGSDLFDDGFLLPNTENWEDLRTIRAFRAAVNRNVDSIIITPGADMPSWMDENMAFSMLGQFKSFTFASTNRSLLSGAQQADMALVNGMAFSLALGTVSYYLWANSVGGTALAEANKFDQGQWMDEAISRSGLLGVFSEPYEIAQRIPATQNLVTFANKRTTRRRATNLLGAALGPSFDLGEKAASVITGIDSPTQSTLHQARLMAPWQNVFWLRQALNAVENQVATSLQLPETR